MNAQGDQERAIFLEAIEQNSREGRANLLERICEGNQDLRARVERLLQSHELLGSFHDAPWFGAAPDSSETANNWPSSEHLGARIGPYKLRELLGEGGMGAVYVAEQEAPIRRKVALKVIKPGMDTRHILARFDAERQTLALMDHPNIAKVLDAGATDSGRPYFVMELVRGVPITEFCDQRRLDPRRRLEIFIQVCRAIQHAHQKGVIHRDVKPTNVLVTLHDDLAVPKVIDFGIAKATGQQLTEQTIYTAFSQIIGTPLYMSPEQAEMNALDVDTRSDVYSLGVLLFELLTGSTPFDSNTLRQAGFDEMRRLIREVDPPRPSQRVSTLNAESASTVSQSRGVDQRRLGRALRGDLDWVVMKCLEKDRNRRYESASALAADVQRHLDGEPIEARPRRLFAGVHKWSRRHRSLVWASATTMLVSALVIAASVGWTINDRQSRQATLEAQVLLTLDNIQAAYNLDELQDAAAALLQAESLVASGEVGETIAAQVEQWRSDLQTVDRLEQARLNSTRTYQNDRWEYSATPESYQLAFAAGGWNLKSGKQPELATRLRKSPIKIHLIAAIDDWASLLRDPERANLLGLARAAADDPWRESLRHALENDDVAALKQVALNEQKLARSRLTIATVVNRLMRAGEGQFAIERLRRMHPRHPTDFWINYTLGEHAEPREAIAYLIIAISQRPDNGAAHNALGNAFYLTSQYARAEPEFRRGVELQPDRLWHHTNLAGTLRILNNDGESERVCREALRLIGNRAILQFHLGDALEAQGRDVEAVAAYQEAIRLTPDTSEDTHLINYIAWLMATSQYDELRDGQRALALATTACTLSNYENTTAVDTLAGAYAELGDFDNAVKWVERALEMETLDRNRPIISKHRDAYLAEQPWREK